MNVEKLRERVYRVVEVVDARDWRSRTFHLFIFALIVLNVAAIVLKTVQSLHDIFPPVYPTIEFVTVAVFTIEYALRMWCITADPRYAQSARGRLRFAATPMAIIDLLSILPFYLQALGLDFGGMNIIRILRLVRVLKLARYFHSLQVFGRVMASKREELLAVLLIIMVLIVLSSTLVYYAEHDAQPAIFTSIPATMWWASVTLTTVGYGDMCPVTPAGKTIGAVIAILSIGLFAIPAGILGSAFIQELQKRNRPTPGCPHCGRPLPGPHHEREA
jgi:voltage-gated potassium channel